MNAKDIAAKMYESINNQDDVGGEAFTLQHYLNDNPISDEVSHKEVVSELLTMMQQNEWQVGIIDEVLTVCNNNLDITYKVSFIIE
jgi:hypothetical protein